MESTKVGETWRCKKTVCMDGNPENIAYVSGKEYECKVEGCLTNKNGNSQHSVGGAFLEEHFEKVLKYEDIKDGEVFQYRISPSNYWISRKGKNGYLGNQGWGPGALTYGKAGTCSIPTPEELAWFEQCEKNQSFTNLEYFKKLKESELAYIFSEEEEQWECIQDVVYSGVTVFRAGKVYKCEQRGCLTTEQGRYGFSIKGNNDYSSHFRRAACCYEPDKGYPRMEEPGKYIKRVDLDDNARELTPEEKQFIDQLHEQPLQLFNQRKIDEYAKFWGLRSTKIKDIHLQYPLRPAECFGPLDFSLEEIFYNSGLPNLYKKKKVVTFDATPTKTEDLSNFKLLKLKKR